MKILALEFSSRVRSVALTEGERVVADAEEHGARGAQPLRLVESALAQSGWSREDITHLAVGLGPGSHAGIRIAIAIAQGWQLARGVSLSGHSSAEVVAWQAAALGEKFSVGIDAQRGELYVADYVVSDGRPTLEVPFRCVPTEELEVIARQHPVYRADAPVPAPPVGIPMPPRAGVLAGLAARHFHEQAGSTLAPIYLRPAAFVKAPPARFNAAQAGSSFAAARRCPPCDAD